MSKPLKTGLWARSSRLLGMAARVASHEVKQRARDTMEASAETRWARELETRVAQATAIADSLSELKGAAMKAGQMLSIDAGDLLPEEATAILGKLHADAEPVPFATLRAQLEGELGERLQRLEGLDEEAAASASIGQVHRATVDGAPVAVKIQYPGIADSIDADVAMLERLADTFLTVTRSRIEVEELFEEMRQVLHLEADYARECDNLLAYGELLRDPRFTLPRAYPDLSSPRILVMSWEEGESLASWIASAPSARDRHRFAEAMLDLYCMEFFDWGFVQTDPNHGNFLVRTDEAGRWSEIVLLDFGATLRYDASFIREYASILQAIDRRDRDAILERGLAFDLLDPREPEEARELFVEMMLVASEPFLERQPFVFRDASYMDRARDVGIRFTKALVYSPPPRNIIFLHRKLGGLFQLLKRLDVTLDLSGYWQRMVADPVARAS